MLIDAVSAPQDVIAPEGSEKEMLSAFPDGARTKVRINSSSLSVLQSCPRKAQFTLERGLRPREGGSPATLFGSAVHRALEIFYCGEAQERILPKNLKEKTELMAGGTLVEGEEDNLVLRAVRGFLTEASPLASLPSSDKRSLAAGAWMLHHYFETYIDDPFVVWKKEDGSPAVELPLAFPLWSDEELEIEYFGTVDVILRNEQTGQIVVCDHKTSSVVGNDFYNRLKPNHQYTGYLLGAREVLGLETDTFLVNCLQVKPKPKTSRGGPPHFPRQATRRTEEDFREFRKTVAWEVERYLEMRDAKFFPLGNPDSCANYGGCQYLPICSSHENLRENIIEAQYSSREERQSK